MLYKRSFFIALLLLIGLPVSANGDIMRPFLIAGTGLTLLGQLEDFIRLDSISQWLNVSKSDIRSVVGSSMFLAVLGNLPLKNMHTENTLRKYAFRVPFFAALHSFVASKRLKSILTKVPLVGTFLGACDDITCQGECNSCKIRTTLMSVGLWQSLVGQVIKSFERKLGIGVSFGDDDLVYLNDGF